MALVSYSILAHKDDPVKHPKLRGKTRSLASEFIAEEMRTHKYPRKQAIAIGISRAQAKTKETSMVARLKSMLAKY